MDSVAFTQEDGTSVDYYVLAQAEVGQNSYLLCTDREEGDAEAFVMTAVSGEDGDGNILYESVEDEDELRRAVEVLGKQLDDVDILM